jgi:hypothetical protein
MWSSGYLDPNHIYERGKFVGGVYNLAYGFALARTEHGSCLVEPDDFMVDYPG